MASKHTVVLMSGGIDSAATVAMCKDDASTLTGLFIDYGQSARDSEWEAAQRLAEHFAINVASLTLFVEMNSRGGEYFGRNALFVLTAAASSAERPLAVALGIHSQCPYYDTTPLFSKHMQRLLDGYSGGEVTLIAPFLSYTKKEVIEFAEMNDVPLRMTYSCERQNSPACGQCPSCQDRRLVNAI